MLQIALLGAGQIGREHAQRLRGQVPDACLHSVVDPCAAGASLADAHGVAHHLTLEALLSGPLPDAAIIATPNDVHVPQALALLRRGVPVLIEKPLAHTLEAGQALVDWVQTSGVPVLVGHHRRHSSVLQAAKACVCSGQLGRLVATCTTVLFHKPAAYFEAAWRRQPGGGPILINLIHEIDALRWLAGDVLAVQAASSNATRHHAVEDSAAVLLEFASGALGTLIVSDTAASVHSWEQTSAENPAYAHNPQQHCLLLAGTQGTLAVPTLSHWHVGPTGGSWFEPMQQRQLPALATDPLQTQLTHFCDVVRGRAPPLVSAADALASLRTTLAVHAAANGGQRIPLTRF